MALIEPNKSTEEHLSYGLILSSVLLDISHGLVVSGANRYDIPTDLRVPDLG